MITAENERVQMVEAIEAAVSDYLIKPFDKDRLLENLEKYENVCSALKNKAYMQ